MTTKLTYDELGISHRYRSRKERLCKGRGCKTVLNNYNPNDVCHICQAKRLQQEFDCVLQKEFNKKRKEWFQLSKWREWLSTLDNIGLNFKHRQVRSEQQEGKKMYAVWVRD